MATYAAPIVPGLRGQLSSEVIRDQFGLISTAFGLLPNAIGSGSQGFTGGEWTGATLTAPVISGGTLGSASFLAVALTAYHIFGKTSQYDAGLNAGYVGLVRDTAGKLRLWDGPRTKLFTDDAHNLVMGSGASEMALASAEGHLYVPSVNGTATGAPTAYTGAIPLIVDRAAKRLGIYVGGGWKWTPAMSALALSASATYDPPSLADGEGVTTTVAVTGAAMGEFAQAAFSLNLQGVMLFPWVSATNTVSVRFQNESGGVVNLGSGTLTVAVTE